VSADHNLELHIDMDEYYTMSDELFNDLKIILLELPFQLKAHLRNNHIVSTGVFEIKYHSIAQKKQRMVPPRERAAAGNCRSNCRIQ